MNESGYTSAVDGRKLFVKLTWSGGADLDLCIGEPDPGNASDPERMIWYSPAAGVESPNGRFSPDSNQSGLHEETWTAGTKILPGTYHVAVTSRSGTGQSVSAVPRLRFTMLATSTEIVGDPIVPGGRFEAANILVSTSAISIQTILPEPPPEEE